MCINPCLAVEKPQANTCNHVMPSGITLRVSITFNEKLKKYCSECGIPYRSSHKIRFYNASSAYDGKNISVISKLMGHSQVSTTMHYLRNVVNDDAVTDIIEKALT